MLELFNLNTFIEVNTIDNKIMTLFEYVFLLALINSFKKHESKNEN